MERKEFLPGEEEGELRNKKEFLTGEEEAKEGVEELVEKGGEEEEEGVGAGEEVVVGPKKEEGDVDEGEGEGEEEEDDGEEKEEKLIPRESPKETSVCCLVLVLF